MTTTTYTVVSQRTTAWAATKMLEHAEPIIVLSRYGQSKPIPKNTAEGVKFRRPVPFTVSTIPAAEGVTPTSQVMQYEDVPATLYQYIGVTTITDKVQNQSEDPVLSDASELSGEQAAETIEMVTYGVVKAGTNIFYTNGSATTDVNTTITLNAQRAIVRNLKLSRTKKITKRMASSVNYDTYAVDASYFGFCSTDMVADVRNITGFTPVEKYGSMKAEPYEIGKVEDVRYIESPLFVAWPDAGAATSDMITTTGSDADVYPIIYIGKEAFGTVPLKGAKAITPMILAPDVPRGGDPAGQRGTVAWKVWYQAVILNQTWMAILKSAATDL